MTQDESKLERNKSGAKIYQGETKLARTKFSANGPGFSRAK